MQRRFCIVILLLCFLHGLPQKRAGDRLFARAEYYRAIPKYKRGVRHGDAVSRKESHLQLAECYRLLNDYKLAAEHYKAAQGLGAVPPDTYYHYGMVLKSLQRYPEAIDQFANYLAGNPMDGKAISAARSSAEVNYLNSRPRKYALTNLAAINTARSEFCAYELDEVLVYTGEKQLDMIENPRNDVNGMPYLNVLVSKRVENGYGSARSFSRQVNTSYHDGPVAFSADWQTLYLTRVNYQRKADKAFVNHAKIYVLNRKGKGLAAPEPFTYNSDSYSCAHATISADGNQLFFASDMPGGFGGKDLWVCRRNGQEWDKPQNLGPDINTAGDEMFPYIRRDGVLFFSSNGLPGFGGLDVFSARFLNGVWLLKRNEGLDLNSSADDFGISFYTDSTGYLSSNREGGKGKDDLYRFLYRSKLTRIEGNVLLTKDLTQPASNVMVYLVNGSMQRVDSTRTDEKGHFAFEDLASDQFYLAELQNDDVTFKNKARYFLTDKDGQLVRVSHKQQGMDFVFRNLPVETSSLPDTYDDGDGDNINIAGIIVYGSNPTKPVAGKKVTITNRFNDVIEETTTNDLGAFAFRNLPQDQDYTVAVEDSDLPDEIKVILTNRNGKEIKVLQQTRKGRFEFNLLAIDKHVLQELNVEDSNLSMALKGRVYDQDKKPLVGARLSVTDLNEVLRNTLTDSLGGFEFRNLDADKSYLISFDDSSGKFAHVTKVYIADSKGKIYKELVRNKDRKFEYRLLEFDKTALGDFSVDDPWLEVLKTKNKGGLVNMTIIENVTYVFGSYELDEAGTNILDKVISVLKTDSNLHIELSSHTDSQGSDAYNLQLSRKRARAAVDYLVSKGIARNRLKAVGYGETRLLNGCKNGVECSDEQHRVNRRTEFKILDAKKADK